MKTIEIAFRGEQPNDELQSLSQIYPSLEPDFVTAHQVYPE
jgi:hypothetical protein